ncbi:hypothetical protein PIB30_114547 [Stylosanthes scabra]|uniref:Uncharacterized protein n=1 Tax=Stylosanthes scabra TaxID=79078 RepID=A0ABU6R0L8_9FABA|nr:hypothetical protein [Stylosanthes scabra]
MSVQSETQLGCWILESPECRCLARPVLDQDRIVHPSSGSTSEEDIESSARNASTTPGSGTLCTGIP